MALQFKFKDEHGILQINMSPTESPTEAKERPDLTDPKFDTINNRFGNYDLFGGKYDLEEQSLFRSRYNSVEEELANTPYAFTAERSLRFNNLDVTIQSRGLDVSPSKDIEDDRFFNRSMDDELFGPQVDTETPAFTVTQLIHAQDRYYDLSSRSSVVDSPAKGLTPRERLSESVEDGAFEVLETRTAVKAVQVVPPTTLPVVPTAKRKRESSFAIIAETPASRPASPRSLPVDIRADRISPFRGRGFREETSRHNTPRTSAANSRANSPPRRRTNSLSKIDKMATTAALPPSVPILSRPHSPRNFVKENIEEVRELSELNRERHEAEAEQKRIEDEEALLKEMGLTEKNAKSEAIMSVVCSRTNSRSNSPSKLTLRSRSNSPSAILHYQNLATGSKEFIADDGVAKPVTHRSRVRNVSKSQPQSNEGSPKHSKIPKRQNSVSPARISRRDGSMSRRSENNLKNQKFISNSTSSIHETIRIGSQVHDKRSSKSTQHLTISPAHIKGKPPISPGRGGPPPANKAINAKRLSPIVGTPNKSPIEDNKPSSAKTQIKPSSVTRKPVKTAGNTPATSRLNSRQPSRTVSRDPSPEKRKTTAKTSTTSKINNVPGKSLARTTTSRVPQKPPAAAKPEPKKPINRTNSIKSLVRTPSNRTLNEKPPLAKKNSKKDLTEKTRSNTKINEVGTRKEPVKDDNKSQKEKDNESEKSKGTNLDTKKSVDSGTDAEEQVMKIDNETQYDKITNDKGELVLLTKKNIVSMTTAAITSQPLEIVTTVTNQLPAAFEKAREKGIFERLSSRDSLAPKDEDKDKDKDESKDSSKTETEKGSKETAEEKEKSDDKKPAPKAEERKSAAKPKESSSYIDDSVRLKLLQPPYNNPQVDRVKQKIDEILKVTPEVSTENILTSATKVREAKSTLKTVADKAKTDVAEKKEEVKQKVADTKDQTAKQTEALAADIRSEATKIVNSIITPVEEPKEIKDALKEEVKKEIEPIVMVVNEKKNGPADNVEKMTETLVKGEPEVEVQSSNISTPAGKMALPKKMADGNDSDKSAHSNGGFPQSTSTTPKPPVRTRKASKDDRAPPPEPPPEPKPALGARLLGKCRKCCPCCVKGEDDESPETAEAQKASNMRMGKLNCFRKKGDEEEVREVETAAGKAATIEFEDETKRKRTLRDVFCGCCGRRRRVSDVSGMVPEAAMAGVVTETGCCGRRAPVERRDSILSDRPPPGCCTRMCTWLRGACRRHSEQSSSRRTSLFSKNKSLSPTLPPEDTRKKLDASLVEHTSVMKGSIPVLPLALAAVCCFCNVVMPGLGTILSGMFCLCFGIPRFGVYDGAKQRIGSLVINLMVGAGQFFTVLFCLVGWGWSIWWGVIMVKVARKYRKLKAEAAAEEAEAPPVTANNHTRA